MTDEVDTANGNGSERVTTVGVLKYAVHAVKLVWETSRGLTTLLVVATLLAGLAPAAAAYMSRIVVDYVVAALAGDAQAHDLAIVAIVVEASLVAVVVASSRGVAFCQHLLQAKLAHSVTHKILDKAVALRLPDFEDPQIHDQMDLARRQAAMRPLNMVMSSFTLGRNLISLGGYFALLVQLSWWAVVILVVAGLPSFIAEARFSDESFRFFKSHSPENRERHYIETLLTREAFKKEIGFFGLGRRLLIRYDALFRALYDDDRKIAVRRHTWGLVLGVLGTLSFFGAYLWIVLETVDGNLTLGQMTMYIVVFRQGQAAVSNALASLGSMYDHALYLENLDAFLALPIATRDGVATEGTDPGDGLRVEGLYFTYPGREVAALEDINLHVQPGRTLAIVGHNGSGKTTLVKLLTRQYIPGRGRILLDGLDLSEWSEEGLRARVSVLFQDYNRYKLTAGENIGAGDEAHLDDRKRQERAAELGLAKEVINELPEGLDTRLGRSFRGATELSGGQWQRVAFARALMRERTDLLIFDEPTSAADPKHQADLDEHLREILEGRMGIVVSHRLATARIADRIVVLDHGHLVEVGTHDELVNSGGIYADLFETQASAYS